MNEGIGYFVSGSIMLLAFLFSILLAVLHVVGYWKTFVKAGIPGWHALIPILNVYDICKMGLTSYVGLFTVLSILFPLVFVYPSIKVARAFGKGSVFGLMLWLFGGIFYIILGFGDVEYQGPQ